MRHMIGLKGNAVPHEIKAQPPPAKPSAEQSGVSDYPDRLAQAELERLKRRVIELEAQAWEFEIAARERDRFFTVGIDMLMVGWLRRIVQASKSEMGDKH